MRNADNNLYEFGEFRLDARESILSRGDELVILPPKVFETLFLLVSKQGSIVSKTEMLDTIWADSFVEEGNLTQNIYTLRKVLGRDENGKQIIENVARRGYRITVPVTIINDAGFASSAVKQTNLNDFAPPVDSNGADSGAGSLPSSAPENSGISQLGTVSNHLTAASVEHKLRPSRWRTVSFIGAGILILIAAGFGLYQIAKSQPDNNETKIAPIERLRFQRLTDSGDVVYPTISPNGEMLAYVRLEDEKGSVWVKQIATDSAVQILPASSKGYRSLTFSPDGKYLFFRQEADGSAIYQTSILGGTPKRVAENVWSDFGISPDGRELSFVRRAAERNRHLIILSKLDGSGERELISKASPADYRSTPAFSPDGTKIAVSAGIQGQFFPKLLTINIADGAETPLKTPRWRAIQRALWLPNGKRLIVSAREAKEPYSQLWLLSYPDGEVRRLTNDLEAYFWISLSADGRTVATRQQRIFSHLWVLPDGDLKKARQLTLGGRNLDGYAGLAWTPDDKIIYSGFANNITDIYSINADGSNRVPLTSNAGQDNNFPTVSPDGRFIAFISNQSGSPQIWRMDIDGRNQKQLTFFKDAKDRAQSPTFSPDGSEIFFIRRGAESTAIWKIPSEGGDAAPVSELSSVAPEGFIAFSPDGKYLAYYQGADKSESSRETQTYRIGVWPTGEGGAPRFFDLPMRRPTVQWTGDATFDYSAGIFNSSQILRQSLTGGASQKIIDFPDRIFNFAWSFDRRNLVVARGKQNGDALLITNLPE
jgi:eukaryotic-like serine/threonine-protein kinase